MQFLTELLKDYCAAYRIAVSTYRKLPIHFFGASLFLLLIVGLDTLTPYLLRETTNNLSSAGAVGYASSAVFLAAAYGICWTTTRVFEWLKTMVSAAILARCDAAFQSAFYARIIRADFGCLLNVDAGAMAAIVSRSRAAFGSITFTLFWIIAPTLLQLVTSGIVLWRVSGAGFAVGFGASMFALFFVTWWLAAKSKGAHAMVFGAANAMSSHLVDRLTFVLDIKINNAYAREENYLARRLDSFVSDISRGNARLALILAAQALATGGVLTAFVVVTALGATRGAFKVGDFVMIVGYIVQLTMPFSMMSASLSDLRRNHLALREGFDILNMPIEAGRENTTFNTSHEIAYDVEHADLVVGGRSILKIPTFRAEQGKFTVVIGPSGSGKSSFLHVLLGVIRPTDGHVRLFGADISDLATPAIAHTIAMAPQNPMILSGTLRDNLNYGCDTPRKESFLMGILRDLELTELREFGGGSLLDQQLGIQGRELSGGERQRIALARALAREPLVLVLDEPTSSLDPEREARLIETLRKRVSTIIAVTHRDALRKAADRVYEVRDGCLELILRETRESV